MSKENKNQLANILFNIVIPVLVLTKLSKEEYLGPVYGLVIALLFPLSYGLYEFFILKQKGFISIIGFVGVLLSGGIGLFEVPPHWFAIKEAAIPLLIGLVVFVSTFTEWQLVKKLVYNRELLDLDRIEYELHTSEDKYKLNKVMKRANIMLSTSFIFSAVLNYFLAKYIVTSYPGTEAFNEEVGQMTMYSFPVIALPSLGIIILIFWYILKSISKLTQLKTADLYSDNLKGN